MSDANGILEWYAMNLVRNFAANHINCRCTIVPPEYDDNTQSKKEHTMNISSTILALQMANGVRVYRCRFPSGGGRDTYSFKSDTEISEGSWVVVDTINGPQLAEVVDEDTSVNFDLNVTWRWIILDLGDLKEDVAAMRKLDADAHSKLARAEVMQRVKAMVDTAGVDIGDFRPNRAIAHTSTFDDAGGE